MGNGRPDPIPWAAYRVHRFPQDGGERCFGTVTKANRARHMLQQLLRLFMQYPLKANALNSISLCKFAVAVTADLSVIASMEDQLSSKLLPKSEFRRSHDTCPFPH